jgi:hypothetical protein
MHRRYRSGDEIQGRDGLVTVEENSAPTNVCPDTVPVGFETDNGDVASRASGG